MLQRTRIGEFVGKLVFHTTLQKKHTEVFAQVLMAAQSVMR